MPEPRGLTHNWNVAYRMFKGDPRYQAVFFVNNDVVFPNGSFVRMARVCVLVSPRSSALLSHCSSSLHTLPFTTHAHPHARP
jgi:hypothetical protein